MVSSVLTGIYEIFFKKISELTLLSLVKINQDKCSRFSLFIIYFNIIVTIIDVYITIHLNLFLKFKDHMELFAKTVSGFKSLNIFTKKIHLRCLTKF